MRILWELNTLIKEPEDSCVIIYFQLIIRVVLVGNREKKKYQKNGPEGVCWGQECVDLFCEISEFVSKIVIHL
jgi:hypothetical protein